MNILFVFMKMVEPKVGVLKGRDRRHLLISFPETLQPRQYLNMVIDPGRLYYIQNSTCP